MTTQYQSVLDNGNLYYGEDWDLKAIGTHAATALCLLGGAILEDQQND